MVIWSSCDPSVSPDKVDVRYLATFPEGFPFGLVVEHSRVFLDDQKVFQKSSPKDDDPFEVLGKDLAFSSYLKSPWIRFTYHRLQKEKKERMATTEGNRKLTLKSQFSK